MTTTGALPSPHPQQNDVKISAMTGGRITLPDFAFVTPADPGAKRQVPSLSFLITHPGISSQEMSPLHARLPTGRPLRILFDLGLRQHAKDYLPAQQKHVETRQPYELFPGVPETLTQNGVDLDSIDLIMLSHVHYDHHGDPEMFTKAQFVVGPGAVDVLKNGLPPELGSHQIFQADLLPDERTFELPTPRADAAEKDAWKSMGPFSHTLDLFGDSSLIVINTPGHLPGHVNLLCRISSERWICLSGDAFHDIRLLSGERDIGEWQDSEGRTCCIHLDKSQAKQSIQRLRKLQEMGVEIIAAHDEAWEQRNQAGFLPGHL